MKQTVSILDGKVLVHKEAMPEHIFSDSPDKDKSPMYQKSLKEWLKFAAYLKEEFEDGDTVFYKGEKCVITSIYSSGVIDVQWRDGDTEEIKPNERKYLSHHYPGQVLEVEYVNAKTGEREYKPREMIKEYPSELHQHNLWYEEQMEEWNKNLQLGRESEGEEGICAIVKK